MEEKITAGSAGLVEGTLGDFQVVIKLGDSELSIQAEHNIDARLFKKTLTNEHVPALTGSLFKDIGELYQGLIDAMEKKSPSTAIWIDNAGKITYKLDILVGALRLDRAFDLKLEEQKLDQNARIALMVEKFTRKVLEQEQTISEQGKIITSLEKMIAEQAKIMKYLEERTKVDIPIEFDPSSGSGEYFALLNSKRTAILNKQGRYTSGQLPIVAKDPLPKQKVTTFSVRVDNTLYSNIKIGILPTSLKFHKSNVHSSDGCICYGLNGRLHLKGSYQDIKMPSGKSGLVIKVKTNLIDNKVTFYFEDWAFKTFDLDAKFVQSYDYYPFVQLYEDCDRVSFIAYEEQP